MSLSSRAREALDASAPIGTPEGLLWRAALETLATGETVEPDLAALTGYFASEDLFRGLLHSDELVVRVRALEDATLLAIARGEDEVLRTLEAAWKRDPDPAVEWRTGWIQLAISGAGLDEEAIEFLVDDAMVVPDEVPDSVWLALHRGRADLARETLDVLRAASTRRFAEWQRRPELAIQAAWYQPRWILMLEEHAMDAVLTRWFSSK